MSQRLASVRSFPRVSDYFSPTAYTFVTARIPPHSSIHLLHALSLGLLGIYCVAILVSDIHPDLEIRLQSEDRAHRIGQKKAVTYIDLVSPGTIDEKILAALRGKIDLAGQVLGENTKDWLT